jgi:hypothetical protein
MSLITYFYGFFVGLFIAATGAWKDTLFEPFSLIKFFRSPLVTEAVYLILLFIYRPYINGFAILALVLLASAALERVVIEGYKALIRQPPGKFKSPTKDRGWLLDRAAPSRAVDAYASKTKLYIETGQVEQAGLAARVTVRLARRVQG